MGKADDPALREYDDYIASALRTEGGHLSIGRGGFTLYYARGARLSGYDCESIKACCIVAGLPHRQPDGCLRRCRAPCRQRADGGGRRRPSPPPYHALSYSPLAVLANAYRAAGAEVFNVARPVTAATPEE